MNNLIDKAAAWFILGTALIAVMTAISSAGLLPLLTGGLFMGGVLVGADKIIN